MDIKDLHSGMQEGHFWLQAKRVMIDVLMRRATQEKRQLHILNIGAGTGEDFKILANYGTLTAIDIDAATVALMPDNVVDKKLVADACNMPFQAATFDVVVAFDVLEHIENDAQAVAEIYRCLKPGGVLVYSVPAFNFLFSKHDEVLGHVRRYNKPMIKKLLQPFTQTYLSYWFFFLFVPAALVRLVQRDKINNGAIGFVSNTIFGFVLRIENWLLQKGMRYPWGLSLIGIATKRN
jgi:SAM-dependent methyltransferase